MGDKYFEILKKMIKMIFYLKLYLLFEIFLLKPFTRVPVRYITLQLTKNMFRKSIYSYIYIYIYIYIYLGLYINPFGYLVYPRGERHQAQVTRAMSSYFVGFFLFVFFLLLFLFCFFCFFVCFLFVFFLQNNT